MKRSLYLVFLLLIPNLVLSQIIPSSFKPPVIFDIPDQGSTSADNLEVGDLDGDGLPDIIAADQLRGTYYLYRNNHSGGEITSSSFEARIDIDVSTDVIYISGTSLADIDGDGKPDLIFSDAATACNTNSVGVIRNDASPGSLSDADFEAAVFFETGGCQSDVTVADIDGDLKPDVIVVAPYEISVLRNTSTPGIISFDAPVQYPTLTDSRAKLHVADIDTDDKPEVLLGYYTDLGNDSISIYRNTSTIGAISLEDPVNLFIDTDVRPWHVKTNDFDGDGKREVVVANRSGGISVLKNNSRIGDISLTIQAGLETIGETSVQPNDFQLADLDDDGFVDIVGSYQGLLHFGVVRTISAVIDSAMFESPLSFGTFPGVLSGYSDLKTEDFNQDGKPDVVVFRRNTIAVYENQVQPAPVISSLSAYSAGAGEVITVRGNYFDPIAENNMVIFGQVSGNVISSTTSSIDVEIPVGASLDFVSVITNGLTAISNRKFTPLFDGQMVIDENSFAGAVEFATSRIPQNTLRISDLDKDGKPDIVVSMGNIGFFRNTSTMGTIDNGSLTAAPEIFLGVSSVNSIGLFDLTGDGKSDIMRNSSSAPGIFQNFSTGISPDFIEFGTSVAAGVSTNDAFLGMPAGDLNQDGKVDLLYAGAGSFKLVQNFQRSDSLGSLNLNDFSVSPNPVTLATGVSTFLGGAFAADLDGDGRTDVGIIDRNSNQIKIFRNELSDGERENWIDKFASVDLPADGSSVAMEVIDLDGDGDLEIVSTSTDTDQISIYPNESTAGTISFGTKFTIASDLDPTLLSSADLDGDGKPEIICVYNTLQQVSVFRNINTGTLDAASFELRNDYPLPATPRGLDVGDIDLDGRPDLVVGLTSSAIAILKNQVQEEATISIDRQPSDQTACSGESIEFTIGASGDTGLQYQWQEDQGAGFVDLTDNTTYSGTITETLVINPVTTDQNGYRYRCLVSGDNSTPVFSEIVTLTISSPANPTVAGDESCEAAQLTLTASGTTDGNYRWYDSETSPSPISGEVNSSYLTPTLTETTTYYVSIVEGLCESERIPAVASIIDVPNPETTGDFACYSGSLTLTATGGTDGNYRWYESLSAADPIAGFMDDTFTTPELSTTTTYYVSIVEGICESDRIPVEARIIDPPIPGVTGGFVCGEGSVELMASGTTDGNYRWYDSETTPTPISGEVNSSYLTPNLTETTTYYVSIVEGACESERVPVVASIVNLPAPETTGDFACGSGRITLTASGGTDGNYRWYETVDAVDPIPGNADGTFLTPEISTTTTWYVAINDGTCESDRVPVEATIIDPPIPGVTGGFVCGEGSVELMASGTTDGNYRWYDSETTPTPISGEVNSSYLTPNLTETTTYYVSIVEEACESERMPVVATIGNLPNPEATGDFACYSGRITLTATGGADGNYRWYETPDAVEPIAGSVNGTFLTPELFATTTYYVAIDDGTCESDRTPVEAMIYSPPTPAVSDGFACGQSSVLLMASGTTDGNYRWYDSETTPSPIAGFMNGTFETPVISETTTYYVSIVDGSCESERVEVVAEIGESETPEIVVIDDFLVAPVGADSYQWYNEGEPIPGADTRFLAINFREYGDYTVELSQGQCTRRSLPFTYILTSLDDPGSNVLVYPNPFRDVLHIRGLHWEKNPTVFVYDLNGRKTKVQEGLRMGTDYVLNTGTLAAGVYLLIIRQDDSMIEGKIVKR